MSVASKKRRRERRRTGGGSVGYWAVAFLDLMGYRVLLRKFDVFPLPTTKEEQAALTKKAVRPMHLRRRLIDGLRFFQESAKSEPSAFSNLSPEQRKEVMTWRASRIPTYAAGDSVIMEVALTRDAAHFPATAIDTMLSGICVASINQLAMGADDVEDTLPLRGGVDVGTGALLHGTLYSAALAKAVELEEELAVFPRVLVGDRLSDYLAWLAQRQEPDPTIQYARQLALSARRFLFADPTDGRVAVDFLGSWARERLGAPTEQVVKAWTFVKTAKAVHASNSKLAPKYDWLDRYFRSRLPLWGIDPEA